MWSPENNARLTMLDDPEDPDAMDAAVKALGGELMSHNTYENIVHNKANMDYCIDQFAFVSSRIKCIKMMTGNGPFLD